MEYGHNGAAKQFYVHITNCRVRCFYFTKWRFSLNISVKNYKKFFLVLKTVWKLLCSCDKMVLLCFYCNTLRATRFKDEERIVDEHDTMKRTGRCIHPSPLTKVSRCAVCLEAITDRWTGLGRLQQQPQLKRRRGRRCSDGYMLRINNRRRWRRRRWGREQTGSSGHGWTAGSGGHALQKRRRRAAPVIGGQSGVNLNVCGPRDCRRRKAAGGRACNQAGDSCEDSLSLENTERGGPGGKGGERIGEAGGGDQPWSDQPPPLIHWKHSDRRRKVGKVRD